MALPPFSGTLRKLVIAFDVGTTYSGVGYAILDPGEIPRIQGVTRFPGQENGDFKIPTIIWYTQEGTVRAAGAEARDPGMPLLAEDENLIFVECALQAHDFHDSKLQPLPLGKDVVDVFADFLKYLFDCAKKFIIETHPNGGSLWGSVADRIEFVLSHPNGWEGLQQGKMRQAAIAAGLIPNTAASQARLNFVTEGEASILQGSTRVNVRAERFLRAKLSNSRYGNDEDIQTMLESFEKSAKPTFKDVMDRSFIKFGSVRDRDPDVGIRSGQLTIDGNKAVAEGAVSHYIQHFVSIRVARLTYGAACRVDFDVTDEEHRTRAENTFYLRSGRLMVPDAFGVIIEKGSRMRENEEAEYALQQEAAQKSTLNSLTSSVMCYRGKTKGPKWRDMEPDLFAVLCTIRADTSRVAKRKKKGPRGTYFTQDYKIVLLCGLTELKAQLSWIENGVEKR
ncbi:hypothetical protein PHLCEN_2v9267 [Hermanssonia centrifuga]|uniref:Uncharacterized protein n=1 Tax=Hermanssonia centrifuga TaxID=98765 RepID=A0A2R6NR88_9APHY|nr:hypothetical protein PHLCEN_2v9267 [Hermanssonia centrifuga]